MLVKMVCLTTDVNDTIEYGESQGLQLHEKTKIDRETVELLFTTNNKEAAVEFNEYGAQSFIEFEDGSYSPMYIRKDRDFSE